MWMLPPVEARAGYVEGIAGRADTHFTGERLRDVRDFFSPDPLSSSATFFLDIDDELRLFQLMSEPCVLLFRFGVTTDKGIGLSCDRPSLRGNEALSNLASPQREARRIKTFPAQKRSYLAVFGAAPRLPEDTELIRRADFRRVVFSGTSGSGTTLGCAIADFFSSIIVLSFPPPESKLLGGKCLTYTGTEG